MGICIAFPPLTLFCDCALKFESASYPAFLARGLAILDYVEGLLPLAGAFGGWLLLLLL